MTRYDEANEAVTRFGTALIASGLHTGPGAGRCMRAELAALCPPDRQIATCVSCALPGPAPLAVGSNRSRGQLQQGRAQELCESRGDRPGPPVPASKPDGLCGREATVTQVVTVNRYMYECRTL